jgi:hypothetical protein
MANSITDLNQARVPELIRTRPESLQSVRQGNNDYRITAGLASMFLSLRLLSTSTTHSTLLHDPQIETSQPGCLDTCLAQGFSSHFKHGPLQLCQSSELPHYKLILQVLRKKKKYIYFFK